jgi:hypothetical protein
MFSLLYILYYNSLYLSNVFGSESGFLICLSCLWRCWRGGRAAVRSLVVGRGSWSAFCASGGLPWAICGPASAPCPSIQLEGVRRESPSLKNAGSAASRGLLPPNPPCLALAGVLPCEAATGGGRGWNAPHSAVGRPSVAPKGEGARLPKRGFGLGGTGSPSVITESAPSEGVARGTACPMARPLLWRSHGPARSSL